MKYKPIDKGRMYSCLLVISWLIIFVCAILKLFGSKAFVVPEFTYNIPDIVQKITNYILYIINSITFCLILVKRKLKVKEYVIIILMFTPLFILSLFEYLISIRSILEILFFFIVGCICVKHSKAKLLLETILITCLVMLYQSLTMFYKNIGILANGNFITLLILQIDYYMLIVLSIIKILQKGAELHGQWFTILVLLPFRRCTKETLQQNQKNVREEIGFKIFIVILSLFQFILVGAFCYFVNNALIQYLFIFVSFVLLRFVFGQSYHSKAVIKCTTLAIVIFTLSTRLALPTWLSVLSNILIGGLIAYMMFVMYHFIRYTTAQGITITRGMNKEAMKEICIANNLSDIEEGILTDFYCNRWKIPKIAMKYGYSVDSINKKKAEILKKIKM